MSDILIKGMEMPNNCKNCMDARLNVAVSLFGAMCPFCEKIFLADIDIKKQRLDDCPLVEVMDKPRDSNGRFSSGLNDDWTYIEPLVGGRVEAYSRLRRAIYGFKHGKSAKPDKNS